VKKPKPAQKVRTKPAARPAPAAKRADGPVEHRLVVASIGISVTYASARAEALELRGTATVNASAGDKAARTGGVATIVLRKGARSDNRATYDPANFNRTFALSLAMDAADFDLFHDVFVKNPGGYDPGLRIWVKTARQIDTEAGGTQPVVDFGYRLDLVQAPSGNR
jgi:hypothetical protein